MPVANQQMTNQTQEAQRLMRARSGKEVGPTQAATSSIAEQAAVADTNQQIADLNLAATGQIQAGNQAVANQQTAAGLAQSGLDIQRAGQGQKFQQATQSALSQAGRQKQALELDKQSAQAEQRGHQRALGNKQYLDTLLREGARSRLDDELAFKRELTRNAIGSNETFLRQMLGNRDLLSIDADQYKKLIASIDISRAMDLAQNAIDDAKSAGRWEAAGGLASAGISAYGDSEKKKDSNKAKPTGGYNTDYKTNPKEALA